MLKKLSAVLMIVVVLTSFAACGGGGNANLITPDKVPVLLPEAMIPAGATPEKTPEGSSAYFETDMSLEELIKFYKGVFEAEAITVADEKEKKDFLEEDQMILEEDSFGEILWGITGTKGGDKTPYSVVIAESEGQIGVSVGVGYRGDIIARGMGTVLPRATDTKK